MSLRIFDIPSIPIPPALVQPIRVTSRAHDSPVHVCTVDPTSTYLASGSADGIVKVWDIARGFITHVFTGHGGVVSALAFNYPQIPSEVTQSRSMQLITGSVDTRIRIFELAKTPGTKGSLKPEAVLEGHASVPRGLDVSQDGRWLVSGGRDSVVLIWDLSTGKNQEGDKGKTKGKGKAYSPTLVKTIPILESVEAVGLLRTDEDLTGSTSASKLRFYTGGQHGVVKIWDAQEGSVLFTLGHRPLVTDTDDEVQRQIMNLMLVLFPPYFLNKTDVDLDIFPIPRLLWQYMLTKIFCSTPYPPKTLRDNSSGLTMRLSTPLSCHLYVVKEIVTWLLPAIHRSSASILWPPSTLDY